METTKTWRIFIITYQWVTGKETSNTNVDRMGNGIFVLIHCGNILATGRSNMMITQLYKKNATILEWVGM